MQLLNPLIDSNYPALTVAYTGTAGATAAYPPGPQGVSVFCTTAAYVVVGEAVTANTANGIPIPANTLVNLKVPQGTGAPWRVSAIQIASGGNLYVKPINIE